MFCNLYRMCLNVIVLVNVILFYDTYFVIPIDDLQILRVYLILLLTSFVLFIKFKVKDAKHNKVRVRGVPK